MIDIAAIQAVLAKAREIEAHSRFVRISFRLDERGVIVRAEYTVRRSRADKDYVRVAERTSSWLELERAKGGAEMVLTEALDMAVAESSVVKPS